MQPGEEIESLVDELEQMVTEAKSPLTGGGAKKIVDAQDVYEILDEIRRVFPQEFADARRILKEEHETIMRAQLEGLEEFSITADDFRAACGEDLSAMNKKPAAPRRIGFGV
jgi:hypothetical protein